jgi:fermentation-respiration switch protein FrsA (DUF1100 family)
MHTKRYVISAIAVGATLIASCTRTVHTDDLLKPYRLPTLSDQVTREDVHIRVNDSTVLRGWWLTPGSARGTIIVFCGLNEVIEQWTDRFNWFTTGLQMNVLAFDYRGFGYSSGTATFDNMLPDALTIYDYLVSRPGWVPTPIFLYGHSLGAGVAIHVADFRPVTGVMLESSFTSAAAAVPYQRAVLSWPTRWLLRLKADKTLRDFHPQPIEEIVQMSAPALFIHGSEDKQAPIWMGRKMFDTAGSSKKSFCEVPRGGHDDLQVNRDPISTCIWSFIDELLIPPTNEKTPQPNVTK